MILILFHPAIAALRIRLDSPAERIVRAPRSWRRCFSWRGQSCGCAVKLVG